MQAFWLVRSSYRIINSGNLRLSFSSLSLLSDIYISEETYVHYVRIILTFFLEQEAKNQSILGSNTIYTLFC